jgi:hypothetical protein
MVRQPVSYGSNACLRWDAIFSINILCAESFAEQTSAPLLDKINASGTSYNGGDNVVLQQTYSYFGYPSDSIDADDLGAKHSSGAGPQNCFQTPQIVLFLSQLGHHHLLRGC